MRVYHRECARSIIVRLQINAIRLVINQLSGISKNLCFCSTQCHYGTLNQFGNHVFVPVLMYVIVVDDGFVSRRSGRAETSRVPWLGILRTSANFCICFSPFGMDSRQGTKIAI